MSLTLGTLVLAGCGPRDPGTSLTPLPEGTTEVEMNVGETAQVSLGDGSTGIGDAWGVVSRSAPEVADAEVVIDEQVFGVEEGQDAPGTMLPHAVELTGLEPGTSTVRVLYCTRTEIAEGCDQSQGTREAPVDPIEITVTVR